MASFVIRDGLVLAGQYNLTSDHSQMTLSMTADDKDNTTLGASGRTRLAGLVDARFAHQGYLNLGTGNQEDVMFAALGVNQAVTVASSGAASVAGDRTFIMECADFDLSWGDPVGEVASFNASGMPSTVGAVAGTLLHAVAAETTTGSGTAFQLGAISATQKLYAALHVIAGSGGTLTVRIQSDTTGFPSPTTVATFTALTGPGSQWLTPVAGPVTDTFWRADWTVTGGSFTFAVSMGIR